MERHFIISETDLNGLVGYLQTRPYIEVARGISILMQLKEAPKFDNPDLASTENTVDPPSE
jgi:hypothetical protein